MKMYFNSLHLSRWGHSTKDTLHLFPQEGREADVRKDRWRAKQEKKKNQLDQTAGSQNTGNIAEDIAIIKNNRLKMNIAQHSWIIGCRWCKHCISSSNRQKEKAKTRWCCFWWRKWFKTYFAPVVKCSQVRATFNTLFTSEMFSGRRPKSTGMRKGERADQNANILIVFE